MQPSNMKKKRSVTKVSEKDFADPKNTNYALTHQEQDSEGDLETKIYKASTKIYLDINICKNSLCSKF